MKNSYLCVNGRNVDNCISRVTYNSHEKCNLQLYSRATFHRKGKKKFEALLHIFNAANSTNLRNIVRSGKLMLWKPK